LKNGIPKEIKSDERRVAFFPDAVRALAKAGLRVLVERGAGAGSGFTDQEYPQAGATIAAAHAEIFGVRELVVKGKEPIITPDE
jgi:alanine dehydrogenase